jgi:NADH-quinone oxidoreductase subunit C
VPDATELELIAGELRDRDEAIVLGTSFHRRRAELAVAPGAVRDVLEHLRGRGFTFLASLHGTDFYPEEPRLAVIYEMLDMSTAERISVKVRVPVDDPVVPTVIDLFPTANHQERETYDMFGVVFDGHPDLRRILMPEDYEGHPQRRDFPIGGEPVIYTYNEKQIPGWLEGQ